VGFMDKLLFHHSTRLLHILRLRIDNSYQIETDEFFFLARTAGVLPYH
jgi:hypothetical protein